MAAIPAYAPRLGSYIVFLGSLTLTATIGLYLTRIEDLYLAVSIPLLAVMLYATAARYNHNLVETLLLRHEHALILQQMQDANAKLAAVNIELNQKQDIIDQESHIVQHVFAQLTLTKEQQLREVSTWTRAVGSFSGDLIQATQGPDGRQYLFLGDFTGHDLHSALGALLASSVFFAMAQKGLPVEQIAAELNDKLHRLLPTGYFVAPPCWRLTPEAIGCGSSTQVSPP